eukprot:jgi/Phyca11/22069/fgenesh1_pg.PHYCAscaffold_580_\
MLPDWAAPGTALAAATARALAASTAADDDPSDSSDDDDGQDDVAAAPALPQDPATDGYSPGRAAGMLPAGGVATLSATAQVSAAAATAAAHRVAVVATVQAPPPAGRAVVEHHARAEPLQDQDLQARARVALPASDAFSSRIGCGSSTLHRDDSDGRYQDHDDQAVAAVPMDVDQGARWPTADHQPLSPPPELRVGGKRRRLNEGDDEDIRELAELLLLEEDEAGDHEPAPRLSAASAQPASVLAVYAHNAQRFNCTLCVYSAASFAALTRHRDSRHRRVVFLDKFSAGCSCSTPFASRLAAARHAQACASLARLPPVATAPAAGELSPTADAVNTTDTTATATPDSPQQDTTELAASPPLASSTSVPAPDTEQQNRGRWGPLLPREVIAERVATRLGEVPVPRWGPPLPRSVVASRIADRLLPETNEETKENGEAAADDRDPTSGDDDQHGEWLLRFDGACRSNPGPGGAGAALFKPSGPIVWTCSHYDPDSSGTNNTAEYTALLLAGPGPLPTTV